MAELVLYCFDDRGALGEYTFMNRVFQHAKRCLSRQLVLTLAFCVTSILIPVHGLHAQTTKGTSEFAKELQKHFNEWDLNKDGQLSDNEIDKLVLDPKIKGRTAAVVATLELASRRKKDPLPPLTLEYLTAAPSKAPGQFNFDRTFASAITKIQKAPRNVWGSMDPDLSMLHQGRMGDCFFIAPLGALLHREGKSFKNMIVVKDTHFEVTFGNGQIVKVKPLTDAEIALGATSEGQGLWLAILEKAYAESRNQSLTQDKQKELATDLIANGGSYTRVIQALTGNETRTLAFRSREAKDQPLSGESLDKKVAQLRPILKKAMAEKRLVAVGTPETAPNPGLKGKHAYAVLAYDETKDQVTLWNPHGNSFKPKGQPGFENGWPIKDGVFIVSTADLVKSFRGMGYETDKPLAKTKK